MYKAKMIVLLVLLLTMGVLAGSVLPGQTAEAAAIEIVSAEGGTQLFPSGSLTIKYGSKTISDTVFPAAQVDSVWMVSLDEVLREGLNCQYSYVEETGKLTVMSPAGDLVLHFEIGSVDVSDRADDYVLETPPVVARNAQTQQTGILVPAEFTLEKLGFSCTIGSGEMKITTLTAYYRKAADVSYDSTVYNNALSGIVVRKGETVSALRTLQTVTEKKCAKSAVTFTAEPESNSVTVRLSKTKNAIGTVNKSFTGGSILKFRLWESEKKETCLKIWFRQKYEYSKKQISLGAFFSSAQLDFSLKVILPDKVSYKQVQTTDHYWKNQFLLIIPGDYVNYYKTNKPLKNSSRIKSYKIHKSSGGNTTITVTTKKLQGYKLTQKEGFFTVKVGDPKTIYKNIVLLDAGHGGKDSGAVSNGLKEKNIAYKILYQEARAYFEDKNSEVKAYWTRHDDTFINLYQRPKLTKKFQADLFISLHMNSSSSRSANGTEIYYSKVNNNVLKNGLSSQLMAKKMQNTLVSSLGSKNRGVRQAGFVVIKRNTVPSILIELGFVSGNSDSKKLRQKAYQKKAAQSIYTGMSKIFKQYPTGR